MAEKHITGYIHVQLCCSSKHCSFGSLVPIGRQADCGYPDMLAQIAFRALLDVPQLLKEDVLYSLAWGFLIHLS